MAPVFYELKNVSSSTFTPNIIEIDSFTTEIYFNSVYSSLVSTTNDTTLTFTIVASRNKNNLNAQLNIKLYLTQEENRFEQTFYHFTIAESIETQHVFGRVNANVKTNNSIFYTIVNNDDFEIDYLTGELMTRVSLDYESTPVYYLTVRADEYNKNGLHLTSTCLVRIDLVDVNDNKPLFDQYVYVIKLNENTSKMTSIFQLNATDADKPNTPNSQVNYKLLNEFDRFYINERTGIVYNKISFDYEQEEYNEIRPIQLNIMAYDLGDYPISLGGNLTLPSVSLYTTCVLLVSIENCNDVAPQFEKSVYSSQIDMDENVLEEEVDNGVVLSLEDIIMDKSKSASWNRTHAFITKVNAKDMDSTMLIYSIDETQSLFYSSGLGKIKKTLYSNKF